MKTLRAKFALLLVVSIVAVVALITLAVIYVFTTPKEIEVDLLAKQFITMERLAKQSPNTGDLARAPAAGALDGDQTELLRAATERLGTRIDLLVTHRADDFRFRAVSLPVGPDRWIIVDIDPPSDPELLVWLALMSLGVGSVAVKAANRMSRPLALLESAVESVNADGTLPVLAEQGPAEVRATAAAINALSARLKQAIESRMRLVAAAGHDLRTPLTRMRLRAEFVSGDEERALWLRDIDELQRIAHSAIQLVHEETTKTPAETLRLDELVGNIVEELREQDYAIEMAETFPVSVRASHLTLSRALRNLFINAATHGVRGRVIVTCGETARITISDEGPGIAPEIADEVFEPFFRADRARSQNIPGAGLGLTISREIIRKAGGDITLANRPGGGLVQTVELPAVAAAMG
ncbi:integral membrane sensor signal transduction histidine kinase [Ancylobacter novellus DSM 506]|uniref:histidine kinase n=1 Tax=Ancylobacter novellus (strain ATCC 8093 / DSM 506 / JCM 20403 / CCM 1077 / IAM 12100 / NBRC 12443 / NCIMB 10456) TaxID=639283 RepID=D7A525_ANCN5|nr:ATP-binding protein [Ancylobacter novellus]ADH89913.1 integral membrane sensor signal transduction histidine kinase [Ancylobacter novellus DSM 506]